MQALECRKYTSGNVFNKVKCVDFNFCSVYDKTIIILGEIIVREKYGRILKRMMVIVLALVCLLGQMTGCGAYVKYKLTETEQRRDTEIFARDQQDKGQDGASESGIDEDGEYDQKDDVALYICTYRRLPGNYITKKEAKALGWKGGELEPYAPGKSIGGDRFGNYEELLPEKEGRIYTECDIDTKGKGRGAKRIVFSDDGLIYYTENHYESFELLYGEE